MPTVIHFVGGGHLSVEGDPVIVGDQISYGLAMKKLIPFEITREAGTGRDTFWVNPMSVTWTSGK